MAIATRLTERLGIQHPVICAPMALATGGALAAAVSHAGGLGLVAGAYCDREWTLGQVRAAGNARVGAGFITWALAKAPDLLTDVLKHQPAAVFLSFGDPQPFADEIKDAGAALICQVQSRGDAEAAIAAGADVIVAQGAEAGGHGEVRATMSFVPEVRDLIERHETGTLLCAAGGIADGRGLAAALALGADGVVMGSRFWASAESLAHDNMIAAGIAATGDDTIRSSVMDIARRLDWPGRFTARVLRNGFTDQWHGREADLIADADAQAARWRDAWAAGDTDVANTFVGEAAGLIHDKPPAGELLQRVVAEAESVIAANARLIDGGRSLN
ncbi:MAG: nitronate monooxygenase [Pseudomonadota bacterium]